eukprot:TRINITY_DN10801_c0_g1_i7.p1 TRINITY_DN10801_c0_g1~~TRINITY_DN10801_c0_g1_i7.p1  ORF type:complete len:536 (+),score=66.92 TRINITY_DN10801_c0_g1_i7:3-1610(+)
MSHDVLLGASHVFFATTCAGLEAALIHELISEVNAHVLGPFYAAALTREQRWKRDAARSAGNIDDLDHVTVSASIGAGRDEAARTAYVNHGARSSEFYSACHELAFGMTAQGAVIFKCDSSNDDVIQKLLALTCAKGVFSYLTVMDLCDYADSDTLSLALTTKIANGDLRWQSAMQAWQQSGHTTGLPITAQAINQLAEADLRQRLPKLPKLDAEKPEYLVDQNEDALTVTATLSAEARQMYTISLTEAQTLALQRVEDNVNKITADPAAEPVLQQPSILFRATVEKYTAKAWPLTCQDAAAVIGAGVQHKFGWHVNLNRYHLNVYTYLLDCPRAAIVGIALRNPDNVLTRHRAAFSYSGLQAHIAAALARLARPQAGQIILDPMCGGMSIAIEGAQQYPDVCFLNSDLSEDDLAIGADNIAQCNSTAIVGAVDGLVCSSVRVPFGDNSIDTIVTDMPWGKRCSSPKLNRKLYPKLLSEWNRVLKPGGCAYALTMERKLMHRLLDDNDKWRVEERIQCSVGFKVYLFTLSKTANS